MYLSLLLFCTSSHPPPFRANPTQHHALHNHFKPLLLRPRVILYHLQLCSARLDRKYGVEPEMCFLW
uniref:Putative secreted peptide n=1 Tax=Anopheles braziliensis TaxID=58242 RepID=A0A2M3ZMF1_9DIPT